MTAALDLPADLSAYEFDIACDYPACGEPAAVMCKGCSDPQHLALCGEHLAQVEESFEACKPAVCSICYRPFIHFETHFEIAEI